MTSKVGGYHYYKCYTAEGVVANLQRKIEEEFLFKPPFQNQRGDDNEEEGEARPLSDFDQALNLHEVPHSGLLVAFLVKSIDLAACQHR